MEGSLNRPRRRTIGGTSTVTLTASPPSLEYAIGMPPMLAVVRAFPSPPVKMMSDI